MTKKHYFENTNRVSNCFLLIIKTKKMLKRVYKTFVKETNVEILFQYSI